MLRRGLDGRWQGRCPRCGALRRLGLVRPVRERCTGCGWAARLAPPWDWMPQYDGRYVSRLLAGGRVPIYTVG